MSGVNEFGEQPAEVVVPQARPLAGIVRVDISRVIFLGDVELGAEDQAQLVQTLHPGGHLGVVEVISFKRAIEQIEVIKPLGQQLVAHEALVFGVAIGITR